MLLQYGLNKIPATTVQSNTPAFDPYAAIGFNPSTQYSGFLQQGNNNLYVKDGNLYQSYTPSPSVTTFGRTIMGQWSPVTGPFGQPYTPSYSPFFGYGGGLSPRTSGGPVEGTIYSGEQAFRPYSGDAPFGFNKTTEDDKDVYNLSQAAISSLRPAYTPTTNLGYNPVMSLLAPQAGGYGAGKYLSGDANMALNFSAPTGE